MFSEQVTVSTSYILIVGESGAELDGKFKLSYGFILNNVSGVKIKSLKIKNFLFDGIYVNRGTFNDITNNLLENNNNEGN